MLLDVCFCVLSADTLFFFFFFFFFFFLESKSFNFFFFFLCFFCFLRAGAQSGDALFTLGGLDEKGYWDSLYAFGTLPSGQLSWKLLRANKTVNSVGRYGVFQSMSVNNFPSARAGSCMDFVTSSHAIMFGGRGIDSTGKEGFLNDLWVSEDMVQFGWYAGEKYRNGKTKMTHPDATPSARWKHACGAHPESKSFVVFGGVGEHPDNPHESAILDDVFIYSENGWTFVAGGEHSQTPDYTNKNAKLRNPGSRADHASAVVENLFYVFGGQSVIANEDKTTTEAMMADLWSFDLKGHYWTYVSGSTLANARGEYPSAIGTGGEGFGPGARVGAAMAFNQLTNELFVFGGFGYGYVPGKTGYLNDLWSYNTYKPVSVWTWLGGSSSVNSPGGMSGTIGFPASIPARANALLFSGNDGYEAELTLIGGVALESADKPEGIADAW